MTGRGKLGLQSHLGDVRVPNNVTVSSRMPTVNASMLGDGLAKVRSLLTLPYIQVHYMLHWVSFPNGELLSPNNRLPVAIHPFEIKPGRKELLLDFIPSGPQVANAGTLLTPPP
jgi:hypothetical protein